MRVLLRCGTVLALAGFGAWAQTLPPAITQVVNWANMAAGPIAPGMMASLSGTNLASSTEQATAYPFPVALVGVSVLVSGKAAPLSVVSPTQIVFQVPFEVTGTSATIQVTNQVAGQTLQSAMVTVAAAPTAPVLQVQGTTGPEGDSFLWGWTPLNPALPGATVIALGTGFGATNPVVADGANPASPAPVVAKVMVTVGGENATVLSATMVSPGQYQVSFAMPSNLAAGNLFVVMNVGGVNTQTGVVIPVALTPPGVTITGVSNNASGTLTVESGSWISIYGIHLSSTTRMWQASDFSGSNLPLELDGVGVQIGGKAAAVYYISPTQVDVQAPSGSHTGSVPVVLTNGHGTATGTVTLATYAPGFFCDPWLAARHADGAYVAPTGFFGSGTPSRPATPGETVQIYGSGFGPTTPGVPAGQVFNGAAPLADATLLHVAIGGVPAAVSWAGMVAAGLYQINVVIPSLADGDQRVSATIGGVSTQEGPSIPVEN